MTLPSVHFWLADLQGGHDDHGDDRSWQSPKADTSAEPPALASEADLAIAAGIRAGDAVAFERLYVQYYPRLYPYAVDQTRDRDVAAELVHDVFLALWRRRADFALQTTLASYLYVAVRNRATNARRIVARDSALRIPSAVNTDMWGTSLPDVATDVAQADLVARIWDEVGRLPAARREALTLRWRHGLAPEEIARVMGLSVAAAKMQVSRALQMLRERLADIID